jgi:transcriptional repressor NrdR
MEGLKALDDVAYVRFASVYRNFREAQRTARLRRPGGALSQSPAAKRAIAYICCVPRAMPS